MTDVNTKHVTVPHPVPRDPDAYRATVHFGQRLRERVQQSRRDEIIRECFRRGHCRGTRPTEQTDAPDDVSHYFAFEARIFETDWRLAVGLRDQAFLDDDCKHLALTIMEVDRDA